jgi:phosphoglycerate dehydrogenase-like enzyme
MRTMSTATVVWTEPMAHRPDLTELLEAAGCTIRPGLDWADRSRPFPEDDFVDAARGAHGIMLGGRDRVSRRVLEAGTELIIVSKRGIGVDKIDLEAATELGIMVTNTPVEGHREAVAEYAVSLLFGIAKQLHVGNAVLRAGRFDRPELHLLTGKTLGIIGYGHVGRNVGRMMSAFGMDILSYDPYGTPDETSVELDELLQRSDAVTLHAALSAENHHLLDPDALTRIKPGALVVNTARGGLIDEQALAGAIRDGRVGGAALNVFEHEPPDPAGPMFAEDLADRTILTPHGAGQGVPEIREAMPLAMATYHLAALRGEVPTSTVVSPLVNPAVLDRWRGHTHAPLT